MLKFTLRQLEYAVEAAEHGTIAGAAKALGVAQPSLSAALKKLEEQIGLQVFIRNHAQGISPSPQGAVFLAQARRLLAQAQEIERDATVEHGPLRGVLRLGSFITLAPAYTPRLISQFNALHPDVEIRLEEGVQQDLLQGLRQGRHDLALIYDVELPVDIAATALLNLKPYVLLPAGHRLARNKKISLSALAQDKLILLDIQPSRTYFLGLLAAQGIVPKIGFSSASLELVRGMVGRSMGYSLLVTKPVGDVTYDGEHLAIREISGPVEPGIVAIASLKQMRKTKLAKEFEAFCVEQMKAIDKSR